MTESLKVSVPLPGRAYDILIGAGIMQSAGAYIAPFLRRQRVVIVSDRTVADLHLSSLREALLEGGISSTAFTLDPGEGTKNWSALEQVCDWLLSQGVERGDVVIAFGGGVIGDLVGFAASILRRGVRFVQIPTTLLAQVDSSVGGKTGINTRHGKNLIGAFHQPSLVLADVNLLGTLQPRDFLAGYGEVAKYGCLGDLGFFEWLEVNGPKLITDKALCAEAVARCCAMKARIVVNDETEQGERALLNLGHTFGHALEAATGYGDRLVHGEGVAIGMVLAFELSAKMGLCAQEAPSRVAAHLVEMGMKSSLADISGELPDEDGLIDLMRQDKKVLDGKMRFVLNRAIGDSFVCADVNESDLRAVLQDALSARAAG